MCAWVPYANPVTKAQLKNKKRRQKKHARKKAQALDSLGPARLPLCPRLLVTDYNWFLI